MILKASVTFSVVAPPPDVEKVGGFTAKQLNGVHGRHGKSGTVDKTADVAIERDVREIELGGFNFRRIFFVEIAQCHDLWMPKQRI